MALTGLTSEFPRRIRAGSAGVLAGLLAALWLFQQPCQAADQSNLEYRVKAAFLLNFTKFIDWPPEAFAEPASPITICILGDDPFGRTLDQIVQGQVIDARRVVVQRIAREQLKGCQVLFISRSEKDFPKVLGSLSPGILTVGDADGFLHGGGMIGFAIENRRVRFDINQKAAGEANLKISSKLLNVARSVEK